MIAIESIKVDESNFDRGNIEALAEDIKDVGLLQPLIVVEGDDGYHLKAGHRRLKALILLDRKKARCTVFNAEEFSSMDPERITISENLQREDLTPLQECELFARLKVKEYDDESIAQFAGKTRTYVRARLALSNASKRVRINLRDSEIELGHALLLSQLPTKAEQDEVLEILMNENARGLVSVADLRHHLSQEQWEKSRQVFVCQKTCKYCMPAKLSLFDEEEEPAYCTSNEHLAEEKELYVEKVLAWGVETGLAIEACEPGEYFDTHGLNKLSGDPPWDLPEDTEKLMLQDSWRGFGLYIIPMAQKVTRENGETKRTRRSIAEAKGVVASQVADAYTAGAVKQYQLTLLEKEPRRLLLWTLLQHLSYLDLERLKDMSEGIELPVGPPSYTDGYRFCFTAGESQIKTMLAQILAYTASRAMTSTRSSMLEGILGIKVQDDFRTTPELLKLFTKAELEEIPKRTMDFKGMKKAVILEQLSDLKLSQLEWPELRDELKARFD